MPRHAPIESDVATRALVDAIDSSPALAIEAEDSLQALTVAGDVRQRDAVISLVYSSGHPSRGARGGSTPVDVRPLPDPIAHLLVSVLSEVSRGHGVTVLRTGSDLSTTQAAKLLGCSRPHVAKLIAHRKIPSYAVGVHRRIKLADALAYQRAREERAAGLDELAALSALFPPDGPPPIATHTSRRPKKTSRTAR